jgi:hypothetical protein
VSIAALRAGDLVYSYQRGRLDAVPILQTSQIPTFAPRMVEVHLGNGAALRMSAEHPTADGRVFAELRSGDRLDEQEIVAVQTVDYDEPFTYDILPDSETGTYLAAHALVGSTLKPASILVSRSPRAHE